jgi:hypothetical protein
MFENIFIGAIVAGSFLWLGYYFYKAIRGKTDCKGTGNCECKEKENRSGCCN